MAAILHHLNPFVRLGHRNYSLITPFLGIAIPCILMEFYAFNIAKDPNAVNLTAIFIPIILIIFFAFRDGIRGGAIVSGVTIFYYFYIIYTRNHAGSQLISSLETTGVLAVIYFALAGIIGWLKQSLDSLIEREADEKRRLQAIIRQLPVGVIITDSKGLIVQVNKKVDEILGTKLPANFQIGKTRFLEVKQDGETIPPTKWPIAKSLTTGKSVNQVLTIHRQDHKEVVVRINATLVRNRKGVPIAAVSILQDITQEKELEKRKDDFVNMASHELKTPLTSMKLYLGILKKQVKETKTARIISRVQHQTDRLQGLVNDLLDVSRLQSGKLSFSMQSVRLDALIRQTVEELRGSISQAIKLNYIEPLNVNGDSFRLYQVIANLITNAAKYSDANQTIEVGLKKNKNVALLMIQDFGIGIAKEQQKRIFDRLYQVSEDTAKTFPGLGMGLYISKEIMRQHKGKIWVKSEPGQGSIFYVQFPLL